MKTPDLSDEVKNLIVRMLSFRPIDRPSLAEIKLDAWVLGVKAEQLPSALEEVKRHLESINPRKVV